MPEIYRSAASVLVLRPGAADGYQLLLLHKPRKGDAWQLPQGGVEQGEELVAAGLRELQEEAALTDIAVLGTSDVVYQYDFPQSFRRFRPDNVRGQQIRFLLAKTGREAKVTPDGTEIDGFTWVEVHELGTYIKRKAYAEMIEELFAEAMTLIR